MNSYDGIIWYGYVILIVIFGIAILGAYLIFGIIGFWVGLITAILNIIYAIVWDVQTRQSGLCIQSKDESYFTDEDFINCKVGEWVSRP